MNIIDLNWTALGKALRQSADDAHEGDTPNVEVAYQFLLDNPECFIPDETGLFENEGATWPEDMPQQPNIELIAAYYGGAA